VKKKSTMFGAAVLIGIVAAIFIRGVSGDETGRADEIDTSIPEGIIDLNNTLCPVMGGDVMEGQYVDWEGYRVHFCCAGCDSRFLAEPEQYLPILAEDPAVAELLDLECADCYPESCTCEQPQPPCGGGCH